ncbi:hypothetical protein [Lysinibacillus sp. NPDC047702]|uniref:hypothetical protein n=1 Tax=unclassified Lysinibacillus TaxID=2636778 RepID=UPI003CFE9B4E
MTIQFDNHGVIKTILKGHFSGFWEFHKEKFPEAYRKDILETVQKTIRCGSSDLGHRRYECLGCEGNTKPVFIYFSLVKVDFVINVDKSIQMIGQINNKN